MEDDIKNYFHFNYYKNPPVITVSLTDLERICKQRLILYGIFTQAQEENLKICTQEWKDFVQSKINSFQLQNYTILLNNSENLQARREDNIAHWMLSLCYCKDRQLRNCFIQWELEWFLYRYNSINEKEALEFFIDDSSRFELLKINEKKVFKEKLIQSISIINYENFDKLKCYKTKFKNITMLVQERKVFLNKGYAYFPESYLIYLLLCELNNQFTIQLKWNVKVLPNVTKDDRIKELLSDLPVLTQKFSNYSVDDIKLEDLEELSKYHYPLCMSHIHETLKSSHHLKHDCRMQYGIFLKNLGLQYEDAMEFFENEFTKGMDKDRFSKKYSYYFKHYYGKVGGRIDYKPYSCTDIQDMTPGPDQHHGCPFKHWNKQSLIGTLKKWALCSGDICDIEDLIDSKKYQQACTKYYCASRKIYRAIVIESPNQYCFESLNFVKNLDNYLKTLCDTL